MLTTEEKKAGRKFRDRAQAQLDALNVKEQPRFEVPTYLSVFRHLCPGKKNTSASLDLMEVYWMSPEIDEVPAGRFGFVFRRGRCQHCREVAMSKVGRVVDAQERPPTGRFEQWQ